ncbi:putative ribonuclease H-like domain-containing protein [Tanacetum coccineum]
MTEGEKKQYTVDVRVRHSRLMVEFEKFAAKEGESLESLYERLTTLDGRVDIQTKNAGYGGNGNKYAGRQSRNQAGNGNDDNNQIVQRAPRTESNQGNGNVQCYNCNEKGHYARDYLKPRVRDAKYFREQMLLAIKDEAGSNLNNEENDFMLDTSFDDETMEELTVAVMLMARIQPADGNAQTVPSYDAKAVSEVNASPKVHGQLSREKCKTVIQTSDDDQINSNIIFDDPYVDNNGAKKNFREQEKRYLEDICDLEEKLSSHDRIVYKLGQSIQTIHMLGKTPNKVYDPFLKAGLGYKNPERLKKAIAAQQKMYDGEKLHSTKLVIHSPDSEETLEDVEESRLKMRHKMVQINYEKLNSLYETFFPQQKLYVQQTYFSVPSTSSNDYVLKEATIDNTLLEDNQRRWLSDSQNSLREFYKTDVIPMYVSLTKNLKELKEELIKEVQEMLNIFDSIEQKVD